MTFKEYKRINNNFNYKKDNTDKFKYKVIKICETKKEKILLEAYLHEKLNVGINERFINKCKATVGGFNISGTKFKLSKKTKE